MISKPNPLPGNIIYLKVSEIKIWVYLEIIILPATVVNYIILQEVFCFDYSVFSHNVTKSKSNWVFRMPCWGLSITWERVTWFSSLADLWSTYTSYENISIAWWDLWYNNHYSFHDIALIILVHTDKAFPG